jgi:hypothetical protein
MEPQDRLPHEPERGAARFDMPVIREDGSLAHPPQGAAVPQVVGTPSATPGQQLARVGGTSNDRSLVCVFGDVKRTGRWTVAESTRSLTVFGDTILDLREASLEQQNVAIRAFVMFGDFKVIVPPGVDVQLRGGLVFGDQKVQRRTESAAGTPRVEIEAYGAFGDVKVIELEPGEVEPKWYDRFRKPRS